MALSRPRGPPGCAQLISQRHPDWVSASTVKITSEGGRWGGYEILPPEGMFGHPARKRLIVRRVRMVCGRPNGARPAGHVVYSPGGGIDQVGFGWPRQERRP